MPDSTLFIKTVLFTSYGGKSVKIAVVVPYLVRLFGSKLALSVVKTLSKDHKVDLLVHTINPLILESVQEKIGNASLITLKETNKDNFGIFFALRYQVFRGVDKKIFQTIKAGHKKTPYDIVIVIANEGRSIGQYISSFKDKKRPLSILMIMELHDHGFHMYYDRPFPWFRLAIWPAYLLVNLLEKLRFQKFDIILANSKWTAINFEYLYGIQVFSNFPSLDFDYFSNNNYVRPQKSFIAFPTVGLTKEHMEIGKKLYAQGINIIAYGPRKLESVPNKGFIPENELPDFLSQASATLFLFNYEALGLIPLESLASGTPVITLPKQGPYSELQGNHFVKFANDYDTIKEYCLQFLSTEKSMKVSQACKDSVYSYSTEKASELLLLKITDYSQKKESTNS